MVGVSSKAPVAVNGRKLTEKGKPYKLEVGDNILVGLKELWRLERSGLGETCEKMKFDELASYEAHGEFVQLAVSDEEVIRNVQNHYIILTLNEEIVVLEMFRV